MSGRADLERIVTDQDSMQNTFNSLITFNWFDKTPNFYRASSLFIFKRTIKV